MAPPKRTSWAKTSRPSARQADEEGEDSAMGMELEGNDSGGEGRDSNKGDGLTKAIPGDLLVRLLHTFFEKDGTRISRDANAAMAKYMDVFVKEAIARAAFEREGSFLEVSDLEKIAPQLLLDL